MGSPSWPTETALGDPRVLAVSRGQLGRFQKPYRLGVDTSGNRSTHNLLRRWASSPRGANHNVEQALSADHWFRGAVVHDAGGWQALAALTARRSGRLG